MQTLAGKHNLTADVTPTKTLVGQFYALDHDRIQLDNLSRQTTEWDLLTYLAQEEGFDIYVDGMTVHFHPTAQNTTPPWIINYSTANPTIPTLNVTNVHMQRSLMLAKDIQVTVKSSNLRTGKAYVRTVKATGAKSSAQSSSDTQSYVYTRPGLTPDQALQLAQTEIAELTKHERNVTIDMPGELNIKPRDQITLIGTGTDFDQTYFIDDLSRTMDWQSGFTQRLRCDASPRNMTTVL